MRRLIVPSFLVQRWRTVCSESLIAAILTLLPGRAIGDTLTREMWSGTMQQATPMPWKGSMELYLRYDLEDAYPRTVTGVVTYHDLDDTRTEIHGNFAEDGTIRFTEDKCVAGNCDQIVLHGSYTAHTDAERTRLRGTASGPMGLSGSFLLERK